MTPPGKPLGMSDFFALEAGEYLERLDALLQQSETPAADEFVRLARALRGSALMANQQAIAKAAAGVESLARALREGRRPWDAQTKQLAVRAIDDLKIFVRRAANWTQADSAKAEAVGAQLDQLAGRPSAQVRAAEALGLDAGARAFVAREGAEFRNFAALLVKVLESEPDIVPVTSLYYEDAGPHVVKQGVPAARPATLGRLELVSHGEHLRQAADSLERAPSPTQRELRAHTLAGTFRALAQAGGGALPERVAQFAAAAREAVSSGVAVRRAAEFARVLRRAGDLLTRSSAGDEAAPAAALGGLTQALPPPGGPGAGPLPSPTPTGPRPAAATASPPLAAADEALPHTPHPIP